MDERTLRRYESGELRMPDETRIALARRYGDRGLLADHPVVQAWIAWEGVSELSAAVADLRKVETLTRDAMAALLSGNPTRALECMSSAAHVASDVRAGVQREAEGWAREQAETDSNLRILIDREASAVVDGGALPNAEHVVSSWLADRTEDTSSGDHYDALLAVVERRLKEACQSRREARAVERRALVRH